MHRRHDVHAVNLDPLASGRAEGDVQHGAVFGHVDLPAGEHGFDAFSQAALLRQGEEPLQGLVSDAVLGIVEVEADRFSGKPGATLGIIGEELAEVHVGDRAVMLLQRPPGRALGKGRGGWFGAYHHDLLVVT